MSFGPSSNSSFDDRGHMGGDMGPEVVQMTRLQLFMAREIGGWPLYTIIIALGQVRGEPALSANSY
jgi:alpha-1,3-glucan synthase